MGRRQLRWWHIYRLQLFGGVDEERFNAAAPAKFQWLSRCSTINSGCHSMGSAAGYDRHPQKRQTSSCCRELQGLRFRAHSTRNGDTYFSHHVARAIFRNKLTPSVEFRPTASECSTRLSALTVYRSFPKATLTLRRLRRMMRLSCDTLPVFNRSLRGLCCNSTCHQVGDTRPIMSLLFFIRSLS